MDDTMRLYHRARNFGMKVERARLKLRQLEHEASCLGVRDIKTNLEVVNAAWDREVEKAKLESQMRGHESSMGVDDL